MDQSPATTAPVTIDPQAVLTAIRRFTQGMPNPGPVLIALIAATFHTSWREAESLMRLAEQEEVRHAAA